MNLREKTRQNRKRQGSVCSKSVELDATIINVRNNYSSSFLLAFLHRINQPEQPYHPRPFNLMSRKQIFFIVIFLVINVVIFVGGRYWRASKQQQVDEMLWPASKQQQVDKMLWPADRYAGATIEKFDEIIDRWLAEMREEPIEVILLKLTDVCEFTTTAMLSAPDLMPFHTAEEDRERTCYRVDIEVILSNRRFRKAYEDLQKLNKRQAAKLLTTKIREHLVELRKELQRDINKVSRGDKSDPGGLVTSYVVDGNYRSVSRFDIPPTRLGRRYAVLSYVWLAALLELREVRPAVEEVVQLAKEEYRLYNSLNSDSEARGFGLVLFRQTIYNPSLLVTASLCDPTWNTEKKKRLESKLVNREIVDYQARATEYDWHGAEGWVPIRPHEKMLKIQHYRGITDAELNNFFGK